MSGSVLSLPGRNSVASVVHVWRLVDVILVVLNALGLHLLKVSWLLKVLSPLLFGVFKQIFGFVKIVLSSHSSLSLGAWKRTVGYWPSPVIFPSCCWASPVGSYVSIIEVVEVVEHEIHILLFFSLEVVNDSLILVDFDSDVRISLPRDSSRLYEVSLRLILLHIIIILTVFLLTALHVIGVCWAAVEFLLPSAHRLVVEFSTLLL